MNNVSNDQEVGSAIKALLYLVGWFFLLVGVLVFFWTLTATLGYMHSGGRWGIPILGFMLLNAVVCLLIGYWFFGWRRWGRLAAIGYTGFWLAILLGLDLFGWVQWWYFSGKSFGIFFDFRPIDFAVYFSIRLIPAAILLLCLRKSMKALMSW